MAVEPSDKRTKATSTRDGADGVATDGVAGKRAAKDKKLVFEDDDEFEDFPASQYDAAAADQPDAGVTPWEDTWDDDMDVKADFAATLAKEGSKRHGVQPMQLG